MPRDTNDIINYEQKENIEVVIARDRDNIKGLCEACPNIKFLYIISTGVEKLPFDTLKEKGVVVVNAGGIGSGIMSEHVMGYILAHSTNVCENYQNQLTRTWKKYQCVESLNGKTLLIIGAGGSGKKIAERAAVFGMRCVGIKKHVQSLPYFERVVALDRIDEELPQADFVVCTIPLTKDTEYLFNMQRFEKMKKGAMFINISRGKLVVEKDLVNALKQGLIGQAVLDVFENEPLEKDSELWNVENLWITPHQAGRLSDFMDKAIDVFIRNYVAYLDGEKVPNQINIDYGY